MTGDTAKNSFYGFGGNDTLNGSGHSDRLEGGTGNDTLNGGAAADYFEYSAVGFGQDTLMDYADRVDQLKVFTGVADSVSDFTITGNGATSVKLTLASSPTNFITLQGAAPITIAADDFVFY